MAILPVLEVPDPRLRQVAFPVDRVNVDIVQLMDNMLETMYETSGIGLAAPQIGILKRVLVVDIAERGSIRMPLRLVNPEIIWTSPEYSVHNEGCLSLPNQYAEISRSSRVRVRYLDHRNETCELITDGLLSTVIQHEMDHLEGVLFVDYLSKLKRDMIMRRVTKDHRSRKTAVEVDTALSGTYQFDYD